MELQALGNGIGSDSVRFVEQWLEHRAPSANGSPNRRRADGRDEHSFAWQAVRRQAKVDRLVAAFRQHAHLSARVDPLDLSTTSRTRFEAPAKNLAERYGLSDADLDQTVCVWPTLLADESLRDVIDRLRRTYCGAIGYEFDHLRDPATFHWWLTRIEDRTRPPVLDKAWRRRLLELLVRGGVFEQFLRKRYPGAKTFSLEGCEALLALLEIALEQTSEQGVRDVVLAMAHRGRLSVMSHILGKPPRELFRQFEPLDRERYRGRGDVRYHLGDRGEFESSGGQRIQVILCFNPSHLEFVSPVALGRVRARQDRADNNRRTVMPILIHGDAAVAGEGIVQETLNLSGLPGYQSGGALHVILNNQIGFTTTPAEGRSTTYASDAFRAVDIPVLHVNGDDLDAVGWVTTLALEYRAEFQRDVVIDLVGYRRFGHNESDEPGLTQPRMYAAVEHHPSLVERWTEEVVARGDMSRDDVRQLQREAQQRLQDEHRQIQKQVESAEENGSSQESIPGGHDVWEPLPRGVWEGYFSGREPKEEVDTAIDVQRLRQLLVRLTEPPDGFHVHRRLQPAMARRWEMASEREPLDWAAAEALALATLAVEGHPVRLVGQDTARGTFSQRHAVLHDVVDGRQHNIFSSLDPRQAPVEVLNSPLCEAAALGFEYGYSLEAPEALVAWEAQFGDFANAAQVIIDQFLSSAEDKWRQLSGLVLLLPHGFEGHGPEHSSARLERLLTLAAEDNLQIAQPSTPAQYFHLLRRQTKRRWCKPLVVLTPKSLLRHPLVRSPLSELASGSFQRVLRDDSVSLKDASRVVLCSGKIYYDLLKEREQHQPGRTALVRIEQFYPLSDKHLAAALTGCREGTPVLWVQEEPENMGAWRYWRARFGERLLGRFPLRRISRPESASPATGSNASHKHEQQALLRRALAEERTDGD